MKGLRGMAARPAASCLLVLGILAPRAIATYWTATSWYAVSFSTTIIGTFTDYYTSEFVVKPSVTPTATPLSTSTDLYDFEDLTVVYAYVPYDSLPASDLETEDQALSALTVANAATMYVVPAVYTAPTTCKTPFTVTTDILVDIPPEVTNQLKPTSTYMSVDSLNTNQLYTYFTMYLTAGSVPTSTSGDFIYSDYIASCLNPTATGAAFFDGGSDSGSGSGSSGSGSGSSNSGGSNSGGSDSGGSAGLDTYVGCDVYGYCTTLRVWIYVVASVMPALFLLGWVESFLWFRRLMIGRSALRLGTISWICISLWMICLTRTSPKRSPADQAQLRAHWAAMSAGTRWKLWWKWGFRHAYPVELLGNPAGGPPPMSQQGVMPQTEQPIGVYGYPGNGPPPPPPGAAGVVQDPYGRWAQQKDQATSQLQPVGYQYTQYSEADSTPAHAPVYEAPADTMRPAEVSGDSVVPAHSTGAPSPMTAVASPPPGYLVSPIQGQQPQWQLVHEAPSDSTPRPAQPHAPS